MAEARTWREKSESARKDKIKHGLKSAGFRLLSLYDPQVLKEAWKKRKHEKELRDYQPAIGHMQDTFNRILPTEWIKPKSIAGKKTYHGLVAKRGVVSTETKELLEGVRTREDAARIADKAFDSGDKDLIEAGLKILQSGNWQDDYMNLKGLEFTVEGYLQHITERMHQAGFNHEEIMTILDDLKETGEKEGRIRAYGYTREDEDGAIRAVNDFTYYKNLDPNQQVGELRNLHKRFFDEAMATGSDEMMDVATTFEQAANQAAAGASFENVMNMDYRSQNAIYKKKGDQKLRNALTKRRFLDEAHIKLRRGNAGAHARNLEAAVFNYQGVDGWDQQDLLGQMLMTELGPNIVESTVGRIHESQGRFSQGFGVLQDETTGRWSLPDFRNTAQQHQDGWRKMINTAKMNPKIFHTIVTSPRLFEVEARAEFAIRYNKYVDEARVRGEFGADKMDKITKDEILGKSQQGEGGLDEGLLDQLP